MDESDRMDVDSRPSLSTQPSSLSTLTQKTKNICEMELEMPFVEKYRPVNVSV